MYYIYGEKKARERFIKSGVFPYFEWEEETDPRCAEFYNDDESDNIALVIDLDALTFDVFEYDDGTAANVRTFTDYQKAVDCYNKLQEALE